MRCSRTYFLLLLLFFSCQNKKSTVHINHIHQELPSGFVDFYTQFLIDSSFQMDRIVFPLAGKNDNIDKHWLEEQWQLHVPFDSSMLNFNQQFLNIENIIIEKIEDKNGYFSMERRFSQLADNEWHLIYYSINGPKNY